MSDQTSQKTLAKELDDFLKEKKIKLQPRLHFPLYNKLPVDLELALAVIQKHEPQIDVEIVEKE